MENKFLIADFGSYESKFGFSGDLSPKLSYQTLVGVNNTVDKPNLFFSDSIYENPLNMNVIRPIQKGIIKDWDYFESYFDHVLKNELKLEPENLGIFIMESLQNKKADREKLTEILFEKFSFPSVFINNSAVLSLYGACKFSGFVIDCGYDSTQITPLQNGYPFISALQVLDIGGKHISEKLYDILSRKEGNEKIKETSYQLSERYLDQIKEKFCYLKTHGLINKSNDKTKGINNKEDDKNFKDEGGKESLAKEEKEDTNNFDDKDNDNKDNISHDSKKKNKNLINQDNNENSEDEHTIGHTYELPDGTAINLENEQYQACEVLYHPEFIREQIGGLAQVFCRSLSASKQFDIKQFESNIIICGGTSMIKGFEKRLKEEIEFVQNGKYKDQFNYICLPERKNLSFIGASIFSLMNIFKGLCTTRAEYKEYGATAINNKCFY